MNWLAGILGAHVAQGGLLILTSHQEVRIPGGTAQTLTLTRTAARARARPRNLPSPPPPAGITLLLSIVQRDLLLALRRKSEVLTSLFFFVIVVSLFPLGMGRKWPYCASSPPVCCG